MPMELLKRLEQGLSSLLESDQWKEYLNFQQKFHNYSLYNIRAIMLQRPTATQVAGFQAWRNLGRSVKKGEKGIQILAPIFSRNGEQKKLVNYKTVYVFDVSQTEGEPLPNVAKPLHGNADKLLLQLQGIAHDRGLKVQFGPLQGAYGYCLYIYNKPQIIQINDEHSGLHQAKTLAHELAHSILHDFESYRCHRQEYELEAESVAFCILGSQGLDTSSYSFGYIADWNPATAVEQLKKSAPRIQHAVNLLLKELSYDVEINTTSLLVS